MLEGKIFLHQGVVFPLAESDKKAFKELQELSDQEDKNILYSRVRQTPLEPPKYANTVEVKDAVTFDFPKAETLELPNGVKVLYHNNPNTPKINLILELRAKHFYDLDNMQGLYNFLTSVMSEGTKNYSAVELAQEIERRGMSLSISPGVISMSMLSSDLPKGLEILEEILSRPAFAKKEVEKVREQLLVDIKNFWDDPASVAGQLTKEKIYHNHPYRKNLLGTKETIKKIRRKDLKKFHEKYISPYGAKLAIVGDLSGYDLQKVLEKKFAGWSGPQVKEIEFPAIDFAKMANVDYVDYYMNRDQVVLSLAALSIARKNKDFDKFLLFDQIFGGGVLGAMHSRLFELREKTGMFYTIAGSSIARSGKQPGMAIVRTIVSLDKLHDAEKAIKQTIDSAADSITEQEFDLAKRAIANSLKDNFETNKKIANTFLFLDKYDLPRNYFDNRAAQLAQISLADVKNGVQEDELERAIKQTKMSYFSKLEDIQSQGYDIGKSYLAVGDENYPFTFLNKFTDKFSDELREFLAKYFRRSVMHQGVVFPLAESDKKAFKELQELSDQEDKNILYSRVRQTPLEPPKYANTVEVKDAVTFDFPKAETLELPNGVKVLYHNNPNTPKINLILELRAKHFYDLDNMQGLYNFLTSVMSEGTKNYSAVELAQEIERRGMSLSISPGVISMSMLSSDLPKGLEILEEILSRPAFAKKEVEKVREQLLVDIKNFWDDPASVAGQLTKEKIYHNHPYRKNLLGTKETIKKIRRKDLKKFHEKYISPYGAKLAIVGDLSGYDLQKVLEKKFAGWSGPQVKEIEFPAIDFAKMANVDYVDYYMNRDQVVLSLAALSIARKNKDFDKFLLFDQIFGGGVLGAMHSRLFELREKTGMFYTIAGSSIARSGKQPGMAIVRTIVSLDKLHDAEKAIKQTIDSAADSITEQEFDLAKRAIANSLKDNFETNKKIANTFLFLDKYDLPRNYFDNRAAQLAQISLADVKNAVKDVMKSDNMVVLRVGRVGKPSKTS
ncbi:M16 family metallopeptidase [Candidatus Dependentiae bacterium]